MNSQVRLESEPGIPGIMAQPFPTSDSSLIPPEAGSLRITVSLTQIPMAKSPLIYHENLCKNPPEITPVSHKNLVLDPAHPLYPQFHVV